MMESRHHNRRVEQAEQSREDYAEGGHQTTVNHIGDAVSDFPADGAYHRMGDDHRRNQGAEGHHNHAHHFRAVLSRSEQAQKHALRQAFNTAIQGSVADMMKIAVGRAYDYKDKGFEFVIGVFDSLMFQVPEEMNESEFLPVIGKLSTFGNLKLKYKWATGYSWKQVQDKT